MKKTIEGDLVYKKIETLSKVKEGNWVIYFTDKKTGENWVQEYPNSEAHGGGAPRLRKILEIPS